MAITRTGLSPASPLQLQDTHLAYLLANSVPTGLRRQVQDELLHQWHGAIVTATGSPYSFDQVLADFRRCLLFMVARKGLAPLYVAPGGRAEELATTLVQRTFACAIDYGAEELVVR